MTDLTSTVEVNKIIPVFNQSTGFLSSKNENFVPNDLWHHRIKILLLSKTNFLKYNGPGESCVKKSSLIFAHSCRQQSVIVINSIPAAHKLKPFCLLR